MGDALHSALRVVPRARSKKPSLGPLALLRPSRVDLNSCRAQRLLQSILEGDSNPFPFSFGHVSPRDDLPGPSQRPAFPWPQVIPALLLSYRPIGDDVEGSNGGGPELILQRETLNRRAPRMLRGRGEEPQSRREPKAEPNEERSYGNAKFHVPAQR